MNILAYILLFGTIILGGTTVFAFKNIKAGFLKLLLAFSGAYLFSLTVLHLIPEVYHSVESNIGIYILIGFFIQIILEFFSEGIEHGHIHIHQKHDAAFPFGVIVGLCLHSFLEGMPLVQNFSDPNTQNSLLAGIILHHIPVAIALMTMLLQSGLTKTRALIFLIIFALMAPLGAYTASSMNLSAFQDVSLFFDKVMAIVIGIFLHISTTILFESDKDHRVNYLKLLIIILGAGLAMLH